ncbi:MAG: SAM-dependent methyltransferase [Bacteroidota bacterium]
MKNEDLNAYLSAYGNEFKFKDENEIYLKKFAEIIKEDLIHFKPSNFLSLGIGHKIVSYSIIEYGLIKGNIKKYFIIDGSDKIIESFKSEISKEILGTKQIELYHSYFEEFNTGLKFDRIEMGFILEHVDDPVFILKKYKEMLTDNGKIHIAVPNARSLHRLIGYYANILDNLYKLSSHDLMLGHKRYYDLDLIKKDIYAADLKIERITGLMLKPITNDQMKKLNWSDNIIEALVKVGENYPEIANCMYLCVTK